MFSHNLVCFFGNSMFYEYMIFLNLDLGSRVSYHLSPSMWTMNLSAQSILSGYLYFYWVDICIFTAKKIAQAFSVLGMIGVGILFLFLNSSKIYLGIILYYILYLFSTESTGKHGAFFWCFCYWILNRNLDHHKGLISSMWKGLMLFGFD